MKVKEVHKISQSSLNTRLPDITVMLEQGIQLLETDISSTLATRGIEMDAELEFLFHKSELVRIFQGLETEYYQKKFFKESFGLVVWRCEVI